VRRSDGSRRRPASRQFEGGLSIVAGYAIAVLVIPLMIWLLFLWRRPDDAGGAMLYDAAHTGFWHAAASVVLVVAVGIAVVPLIRALLRR
jgi:hypothetical protein